MNATYLRHGSGRSVNARRAETDGKLPLTRAIPEVAKAAGVSRKLARAALESVGRCEWHHVGKFAKETNYYSVEEAVAALGNVEERRSIEEAISALAVYRKLFSATQGRVMLRRAAGTTVFWHFAPKDSKLRDDLRRLAETVAYGGCDDRCQPNYDAEIEAAIAKALPIALQKCEG